MEFHYPATGSRPVTLGWKQVAQLDASQLTVRHRAIHATAPWQCLYFLPEPHGQGWLRPTLPWTARCSAGSRTSVSMASALAAPKTGLAVRGPRTLVAAMAGVIAPPGDAGASAPEISSVSIGGGRSKATSTRVNCAA